MIALVIIVLAVWALVSTLALARQKEGRVS